MDALTSVPVEFRAGDSFAVTLAADDYAAASGTLACTLGFSIVATGTAGDYPFTATLAQTALWTAGYGAWSFVVTDGADRETIATGYLTVLPDPLTDTTDARSHARVTLALIEQAIEGRLPDALAGYSIAGRSISKIPLSELVQLRNVYKSQVQAEDRAAAGQSAFRQHLFSFTPV
jgi:hypothetical protein